MKMFALFNVIALLCSKYNVFALKRSTNGCQPENVLESFTKAEYLRATRVIQNSKSHQTEIIFFGHGI